MLRPLVAFAALFVCGTAAAQKIDSLDFFKKPTASSPRYIAITEAKNGQWVQQLYYRPENGLAQETWFKDEELKVPHGKFAAFFPNKKLREKGSYAEGKKQGTWERYNEQGLLVDSATFEAGRLKGISKKWFASGKVSDSLNFDGAGNGFQASFYENGTVQASGGVTADTAKTGRWNYYHSNGAVMATEDYEAGERISCKCYDEKGKELNKRLCLEEDADFAGGEKGWMIFVQNNLNPKVPVKKKAPAGQYQVVVQFVVNTEGAVTDITSLTSNGYGMEQEVERMLKKSPRWKPANQFGRKVNAYRLQPITFVVEER